MKKKLLSLLVVICVVFSILPQTTSISSNNESLNSTNPNSNDAITLVSSNERSATTYGATTTGGVTVSQASDYPITSRRAANSYIDTTSGYLYAVGNDSGGAGAFGVGHVSNLTTYTMMRMSNDESKPFVNPVDWAFGGYTNIIIDANGKVWTAGSSPKGALGNGTLTKKEGAPGTSTNQYSFEMVESIGGNSNYKAIKCTAKQSDSGTYVMLEDGSLWGAGYGSYMGLSVTGGLNGSNVYASFTRLDTKLPEDDNKIKDFDATEYTISVLTTKGNLYTVGNSALQMGGASSYTEPKLTNVAQVKAGHQQTIALKNDGTLWVTGSNGYGNLGLGGTTNVSVFTQVDTSFLANGEFITQVHSNTSTTGVLTNKGNLYMAGNKANMGIGVTSTTDYYYTFTKCHTDVVYFAVSSSATFILFSDGRLVGVGSNGSELGGSTASDANSEDAGLNPPADTSTAPPGEGVTTTKPTITLPPFTPNPETWPQDEVDKLPESEKEELTKPTEPEELEKEDEQPGPEEGGEGSGFEGEDGNNYLFSPPAKKKKTKQN